MPRYFYPRPPRGGRPNTAKKTKKINVFLSTPSSRRATRHWHIGHKRTRQFLSTPSSRRATRGGAPQALPLLLFLSTPSSRRATPGAGAAAATWGPISIHALLAEGDQGRPHCCAAARISIHALLAEGDAACVRRGRRPSGFLSTPSSRRATQGLVC